MALQKYKIDVTKADIESGERHNVYACPLARAIGRAVGRGVVAIDGGVGLGPDLMSAKVRTNIGPWHDAMDSFIEAFDFRGPKAVQPFSFEIEIDPDWATTPA